MSLAAPALQRHNDAEIPILDLAPYLAGRPGALDELAEQLRYALENIGFYFIMGHGVPPSLCAEVFRQAERFHAQPLDWKQKLTRNHDNVGYLPMARGTGPNSPLLKSRYDQAGSAVTAMTRTANLSGATRMIATV